MNPRAHLQAITGGQDVEQFIAEQQAAAARDLAAIRASMPPARPVYVHGLARAIAWAIFAGALAALAIASIYLVHFHG